MNSRSTVTKLALIILLFAAGITLHTQASAVANKYKPSQPTDDSSRGEETGEGDQKWMVLNGQESLEKAFGTQIGNTLVNQIYSEHYRQTGNLERQATITKEPPSRKVKNASFIVRFEPSGDQ